MTIKPMCEPVQARLRCFFCFPSQVEADSTAYSMVVLQITRPGADYRIVGAVTVTNLFQRLNDILRLPAIAAGIALGVAVLLVAVVCWALTSRIRGVTRQLLRLRSMPIVFETMEDTKMHLSDYKGMLFRDVGELFNAAMDVTYRIYHQVGTLTHPHRSTCTLAYTRLAFRHPLFTLRRAKRMSGTCPSKPALCALSPMRSALPLPASSLLLHAFVLPMEMPP